MANFAKISPALLVAVSAIGFSHSAQAENRYFLNLPFLGLGAPPAIRPVAAPVAAPVATPAVKPPVAPPPPPPTPPATPAAGPGGPGGGPGAGPGAGAGAGAGAVRPTIGGPLSAVLNGQNVCRPAGSSGAEASAAKTPSYGKTPPSYGGNAGGGAPCGVGDNNAIGSATVLLARSQSSVFFCYALDVTGLNNPTEAHLHRGRAGVNGPSLVTLTPPKSPRNGDPGASSGCVSISLTLAQAIHANPMVFYIDVVTKDFPSGAIRGQLR